MALNIDEIRGLEFNPNAVVHRALTTLGYEGVEISNANNAFTFLLEYASNLSLASTNAFKSEMRKAFPALATNMEELYPHLNKEEIIHLFAKPGSLTLQGVVYVMSLKQNGISSNGYRETVIPRLTTFTYKNLTFTLTNDVTIRVHDQSEMVEAIIKPNDTLISNNTTTFLETRVATDAMGNPFVQFPLECKQVEIRTSKADIYGYQTTTINHILTDKFYGAIASIIDPETGVRRKINIKFVEDYLNPTEPTVFAKIINNEVTFKLPYTYIATNNLIGTLEVVVYETKGASFLPLYNVKPDELKYRLGDMTHLANRSITRGVQFAVKAERDSYFDGGSDPLSFEVVKKKLITNSFTRNMPVTEYDVESLGIYNAMTLSKVEDNLTSRAYIANKGLEDIDAAVMKSRPDVFNNTARIDLTKFEEEHPDKVTSSRKYIFLPSRTIFKEDNGSVRVLSKDELDHLNNLSVNDKVVFLKNNKFFFNPFYYSISTSYNRTTCEIFNFDTPRILSYFVREMNNGIPGGMTVSLKKYSIEKIDTGYRVYFELNGDVNFKEVDPKYVNIQLTLKNKDNVDIFLKSKLDNSNAKEPFYYVDIDTNLMVEDGCIKVTSGVSTVAERLVNFDNELNVHIYLTDPNRFDPDRFLAKEIEEKAASIVVCTKGKMRIKFGERLDFLWNRVYALQGKRTYLLAEKDIPLVYKEDVYQRDINGVIIYEFDPDTNSVLPVVAHRKGDPVLGPDGEQLIETPKGEPILNSFGEPIIDKIEETPVKNVEILMLEYEYIVGQDYTSKRIIESCIDKIYSTLTTTLKEMNSKLLEKTRIFYKGNKRTLPIISLVNGNERELAFNVSPVINLYVDRDTVIGSEIIENYRKIAGEVLTKYISSSDTVIFKKVVEELITKFNNSNISGLTVKSFYKPRTELEENENEDMVTLKFLDQERRPIISKVLEYNISKNFEVKYDIEINIVRV